MNGLIKTIFSGSVRDIRFKKGEEQNSPGAIPERAFIGRVRAIRPDQAFFGAS